MTPETAQLYSKYSYFLNILDNGRHPLFFIDENSIDYESFFQLYNYGIYMHHEIKPIYRNYKARRNQIIKKFERGKIHILLRSYFCYDLREEIIKYLF